MFDNIPLTTEEDLFSNNIESRARSRAASRQKMQEVR